jgi:hypothetical protein
MPRRPPVAPRAALPPLLWPASRRFEAGPASTARPDFEAACQPGQWLLVRYNAETPPSTVPVNEWRLLCVATAPEMHTHYQGKRARPHLLDLSSFAVRQLTSGFVFNRAAGTATVAPPCHAQRKQYYVERVLQWRVLAVVPTVGETAAAAREAANELRSQRRLRRQQLQEDAAQQPPAAAGQ